MPLPINRIGDLLSHYHRCDTQGDPAPVMAWLHADMAVDTLVRDIAEAQVLKPGDIESIQFLSDINLITREVASTDHPSAYQDLYRDGLLEQIRQERVDTIASSLPGGHEIADTMHERTFTDDQLIEITEAHYAAVQQFLVTGDRKAFWPPQRTFAKEQVGSWDEATDLDLMLEVAKITDPDGTKQYKERLNKVIVDLGTLYAQHNLVGRAIGLLGVATDEEQIPELLEAIVTKMQENKDAYGDEGYQTDYAYAQQILRPFTRQLLSERMRPGRVQLIPGSKRTLHRFARSPAIMQEEWSADRTIAAHTADGTDVALPFQDNLCREIMGYDTPAETTLRPNDQRYVEYQTLPDQAQTRIAEFLEQPTEPTDRYEDLDRLCFGFGYNLQTMDVSHGEWKVMMSNDPMEEAYLNGTVRSLEEVGQDWVVIPYEGTYMSMHGYAQKDVARNAPEDANAFWFTAHPRMTQLDDGTQVVTVPVAYYRVGKTF